jgi:hypothetical protein
LARFLSNVNRSGGAPEWGPYVGSRGAYVGGSGAYVGGGGPYVGGGGPYVGGSGYVGGGGACDGGDAGVRARSAITCGRTIFVIQTICPMCTEL